MNLSHILCPVDLSDASSHALVQTAALAERYRSQVTVLHVHPSVAANMADDQGERQRLKEIVRAFAERAITAQRAFDVIVDVGRAARQIVSRASELGVDMIVMGTHGSTGFDHLLLGSVTEKVLRTTTRPVLTVPPSASTAPAAPFQRILCPIDFADSSLFALSWAWSLAEESGGEVSLLHVIEWPWREPPAPEFHDWPSNEAEKLQEFRRFLETTCRARLEALVPEGARGRCHACSMVRHGKAHREVLAAAAAVHADLIVMGVHGRDAVDLTLFGSTTNQVVRKATCPVLTVRAAG